MLIIAQRKSNYYLYVLKINCVLASPLLKCHIIRVASPEELCFQPTQIKGAADFLDLCEFSKARHLEIVPVPDHEPVTASSQPATASPPRATQTTSQHPSITKPQQQS